MADYGLTYLEFLLRKKRFDRLTSTFKQITLLVPDYLPDSPVVRVQLATFLRQQGDLKVAVKMLNGMHKLYPDYSDLPAAYTLLAECLNDLPNMQAQAEKCRQMAVQLAQRTEAKKVELELQRQARQVTGGPMASVGTPKVRRGPPVAPSSGVTLELVPLEAPVVDKT